MSLTDQIDALLPQTQCTQCGFKGCRPYASAIAEGRAKHNQCPPGGDRVIQSLADLLQIEPLSLNPANGQHQPKQFAVINEDLCIGCKKCLDACPTDAILGTGKMMHTVIMNECTGCELCVEPCPMDCIDMIEAASDQQPEQQPPEIRQAYSDVFRSRHQAKKRREAKRALSERQRYKKNKNLIEAAGNKTDKQAFIAAALARAKTRNKRNPSNGT